MTSMLPEAGAVTVAANFRLMYDKRSELATNNALITGLRRAETSALQLAAETDEKLVKQHADLVTELRAITEQASADLIAHASRTQSFLQQQRAKVVRAGLSAREGLNKPISDLMKQGTASVFKKRLGEIEGALGGFYTRMQKMGHMQEGFGSFGEAFTDPSMGNRARLNVIKELEHEADEYAATLTEEHHITKGLRAEIESLTRAMNAMASVKDYTSDIIRDANNQEKESFRGLSQEQKKNNIQRMQNIQFMRQHIQTSEQFKMAIGMGMRQAIMQSAIALMTLGFRINQTIESFKEFERELMNAQSIFQTTQDILYGLSDQVAEFGTQYGIELNQAAEGLYTLASAGLTASESQEVLSNTLKLSMAVQGDHETIAKLTTQTIFGFGLQMSDSAELTDKFAHAINKSLIEYQDLASAVKFAMPFFITTGQNIDQLLGSLEILTNRALEAGIAGRGLRQALAEFAQHADDNTAAFRKLGVEITDSQGNFLMLTEIAKNFQIAMGDTANDTELLTTLLEDLNVRGATAFVHLVQNADEFQAAVDDLANSAGSATQMAEIQQLSLHNTIQRVKNALMAPFLLSDEVGKAQGHINVFAATLHDMVATFEDFFVTKMADGTYELTQFGKSIKTFVINTLGALEKIIIDVLEGTRNLVEDTGALESMLKTLLIPLKTLTYLFTIIPDGLLQTIIMFQLLNKLLPINIMLQHAETVAQMKAMGVTRALRREYQMMSLSIMGMQAAMFAVVYAMNAMGDTGAALAPIIGALAGATYMFALAKQLAISSSLNPVAFMSMIGAGLVGGGLFFHMLGQAMKTPKIDYEPTMYDMGGRIPYMDNGGLGGRHQMIMVEPGETIIPKTQNMLGSGITLNIQGDIVTNDADDFAERIAQVLPEALRRQNDIGGI